MVIKPGELELAELTPTCIVENYLYADLAQLVAQGGAGKTTLILFEAIHIILGRPLWGLEVRHPGWVLLVTAEDQRERLVARLRRMMDELNLTPAERAAVLNGLAIWDVTGSGMQLIRARGGIIALAPVVDSICHAHRADPPVMVVFDPLASFGISEQLVNDNEHALVTAARRIIRDLGCCVRYVHHTGKQASNFTDPAALNQYAGRGGSALADGTRMTAVMAPMGRDKGPRSFPIAQDQGLIALARPKLSYAPPNQPVIWLRRRGFLFDHHHEVAASAEAKAEDQADLLLLFLNAGQQAIPPRHLTKNDIETRHLGDLGLTKAEFRRALAVLEKTKRVVHAELPKAERRGGRKTFISPEPLASWAENEGRT